MGRYDRTQNKKSGFPAVLVALILGLLVVGDWFLLEKRQASRQETRELALPGDVNKDITAGSAMPEAASDSIAELPQDNPFILPDLDHSDALARQELTAMSPGLADWLVADQLLRKYIAIVNDVSQGLRLEKHLLFLKPEQPFAVEQDGFIDARSYRRYDRLAAAIATMNVQSALALYQKIRPLLWQAFREFGYPAEYSLEDIFIKAAAVILAAPTIDGKVEVEPHGTRYKFADQKLEEMNPVHKQMLRMGPENTRLIQNKLRALAEKLVSLKE